MLADGPFYLWKSQISPFPLSLAFRLSQASFLMAVSLSTEVSAVSLFSSNSRQDTIRGFCVTIEIKLVRVWCKPKLCNHNTITALFRNNDNVMVQIASCFDIMVILLLGNTYSEAISSFLKQPTNDKCTEMF